jgi:DNA-binding beta-propeller fold protein YncE
MRTLMRLLTRSKWSFSFALGVAAVVNASPAAAQKLMVLSRGTTQILEYDGNNGSYIGVFAETVTDGFRLPGGLALRPTDGVLYVSSVLTGELWSYTTATGDPITPAVATGQFAPFGIDFDASGANLYFVDAKTPESENSDTIKQLTIGGSVSTVGTNNQADFLGLAVNGSEVYATDVELDRVISFAVSGGPGSVEISSGLSEPSALLFATSTQMLIADFGNDRVVEYLESGGNWSFSREVLPASAGVNDPAGLAIAPDGRLTVSGRTSGDVVLVDLTSLVVTPLVAPGAGGLQDPTHLAWDGSQLLVASAAANAVFYFDASGNPTGVRAQGLSASLDAGVTASSDGSLLYVGSIGGNDVLEYDVATGALLRIFSAACPNLPLPFDSAIGPGGQLYVSCTLNHSIEHFDPTTTDHLGSFVGPGSGGLLSPRGLAFGPNGNLFVSNGSFEIVEFDGSTGVPVGPPSFVDTGGNGGGAIDPYGLRFRQGVLYVASFIHDEVKAFDATTGAFLSTFVTAGSGGLTGPTGIDFGPGGDLFVASQNDDAVRRYDGSTGAFVEVFVPSGDNGLDQPFDLVFAPEPTATTALAYGALLLSGLCALRLSASRGVSR